MKAWRIHDYGRPREVLRLEELPAAFDAVQDRRSVGRSIIELAP